MNPRETTVPGREVVVGDLVVYNRKLHRIVRLERQQREDGLSARTAWFDTGIGMTAPDDESFHIVERGTVEVAS